MSDPLSDALAKADPPPKPAPTTGLLINKLKDGGFIVGDPSVGGTFASRDLSECLVYVAETFGISYCDECGDQLGPGDTCQCEDTEELT